MGEGVRNFDGQHAEVGYNVVEGQEHCTYAERAERWGSLMVVPFLLVPRSFPCFSWTSLWALVQDILLHTACSVAVVETIFVAVVVGTAETLVLLPGSTLLHQLAADVQRFHWPLEGCILASVVDMMLLLALSPYSRLHPLLA